MSDLAQYSDGVQKVMKDMVEALAKSEDSDFNIAVNDYAIRIAEITAAISAIQEEHTPELELELEDNEPVLISLEAERTFLNKKLATLIEQYRRDGKWT